MANKHVIITVGHNDKEQEEDAIEFLISRNCDALIMHSEGMTDQQLVDIAKDRLPIAVINRFVPGLDGNTCFGLDNKLGGKMATQHLIDNGHTSIAYISGPERKVDAMERLAGHKQALQEASINIDDDLIYEGNFREQNGIDGLQTLLSIGKKFTGLVCANDWMASGAMTCARDMGIKLPDDLSIVGFDDIVFAHHVYPKLTTISNPVYKMGEMAAKSILNRLYGEKHKLNEMYSPVLIERDSVLNIVE
jgi:LacI family transcriptional regulator